MTLENLMGNGGRPIYHVRLFNAPRSFPPNHFHGIVEFVGVPLVGTQNVGQPGQPQGIAPTVGDVVGAFKSLTTNNYIRKVKQHNWQRFNKKLWQRDYYEHIIRGEKSYYQILEYIQTNPLKWRDDKYYQ